MTNVEFLIVGNGLAGTLLAFEMIGHGLDFRIMSSPHKSKASLVAAGMFNPLVFKRMNKSWMVDDLLPVMKKRYHELEQKLSLKFLYEKDILKPLSDQELLLWTKRKSDIEFRKYIKSVDPKGTFDKIIKTAAYGIVTQSGYINISGFLQSSESYFRQNGFFIDDTFRYENYNIATKSVNQGNYNFSKIVFCEGYHLINNPFFNFLPFKPVKGEVLEIYSPDLPEDYIINKRVFILPTGNKKFKVGSTYNWKDLSETPTKKGKDTILTHLQELITAKYTIRNHWAGIRPTIADRRPILGEHPDLKNLYVFNGLGTKGVMLGPYFATEMLKFLTTINYDLPKEVKINRFKQP